MIERQPHWDDNLIEAVERKIVSVILFIPDTSPKGHVRTAAHDTALAVIAEVEDWHKAKRDSRIRTHHSEDCWRWHNECAEALIVSQQAAIQRVREVCDQWNHDIVVTLGKPLPSGIGTLSIPLASAEHAIRRALDGADD